MTDGLSSLKFNISPTAILIPPVQDQSFLNGLIGGSGISSTGGTFAALYFQSSSYSPGQVISNASLPTGVSQTELGTTGGHRSSPTVRHGRRGRSGDRPDRRADRVQLRLHQPDLLGLHRFRHARCRRDPGAPGYSGVQGSDGELLIGDGITQPTTIPATGNTDTFGAVSTTFRRFESIAFDQYGYFSQSVGLTRRRPRARPAVRAPPTRWAHRRPPMGAACSSATWRRAFM